MIHFIFIPCLIFTTFALLHHAPHLNFKVSEYMVDIDGGVILMMILIPIYTFIDIWIGVSG